MGLSRVTAFVLCSISCICSGEPVCDATYPDASCAQPLKGLEGLGGIENGDSLLQKITQKHMLQKTQGKQKDSGLKSEGDHTGETCAPWCEMEMPGVDVAFLCSMGECAGCAKCAGSVPEQERLPPVIAPKAPKQDTNHGSTRASPVSCKSVESSPMRSSTHSTLIFTDPGTGKVKAASMDGSNVRDLVDNITPCPEVAAAFPGIIKSVARYASRPIGIAIDKKANKLFFTDWLGGYDFNSEENQKKLKEKLADLVGAGGANLALQQLSAVSHSSGGKASIFSAPLDGSEKHMLITGLSMPWGIAADTSHQRIYWSDRDEKRIMRANYDGSGQEEIVTGLTSPNGIAIDGESGKIYFSDEAESGGIKRANLDGSGVEDVILRRGQFVEAIALDLKAKKVYWTEPYLKHVHRANLDGSEFEELTGVGHGKFTGVFVDSEAERLYVVDESARKIGAASLDGCNLVNLVSLTDQDGNGDPKPFSVAIV